MPTIEEMCETFIAGTAAGVVKRDIDVADGLRAVIGKYGSMVEWQPIETAPTNGQPILVWKDTTKEHFVVANVRGAHGPGWCTPDGYQIFKPSHWQPLPSPPSQLKAPTHD